MMQLKVQLPAAVLIDEPALKIVAEASNGYFCLEPRHVDFVAPLVPGFITYLAEDGTERVLANDEGILVKCGRDVLISVFNAVPGDSLDTLRESVSSHLELRDEQERHARLAVARLEMGIVRRFVEMEKLP